MKEKPERPAILGRVARVELCSCRESMVLSLGGVAMQMDLDTAEDVVITLEQALAVIGGSLPSVRHPTDEETLPIPIETPRHTPWPSSTN